MATKPLKRWTRAIPDPIAAKLHAQREADLAEAIAIGPLALRSLAHRLDDDSRQKAIRDKDNYEVTETDGAFITIRNKAKGVDYLTGAVDISGQEAPACFCPYYEFIERVNIALAGAGLRPICRCKHWHWRAIFGPRPSATPREARPFSLPLRTQEDAR